MKSYLMKIALFAFMIIVEFGLSAAINPAELSGIGTQPKGNNASNAAKSANCAPRTAVLLMKFNNVSTLLQQGGLLYRELGGQQNAAYEIPKGSGLKVIYAGSLWMGGVDVNGQLKLAAVTYQARGHDFWPGPLTVKPGSGNYDPNSPVGDEAVRDFGEANIDPDVCLEYDKFYTIRRGEVERFNLWFQCNEDQSQPGCDEVESPTNEELNRIYNWPAHGDISRGQDFYLAPFYDADQDGNYNPFNGDHPWYDDILGRDDVQCGIDRRVTLFGDETHWWVFNDKGNIHGESGGDPIGMEIRAQAFAFGTNDQINNMTFYNYELINRGTQTLFQTFFSQYIDADVGNPNDDYAGCDVSRGLGFIYNGDQLDETDGATQGYGANPPAIGVDFFEGPYQDADGKDNIGPVFDSVIGDFVPPSVNDAIADDGIVYRGIGTGYSDNIVDNERFGMRRFTYYTRSDQQSFPYTDPVNAAQYYNFMNGFWADGSLQYYGGQGYAGSSGVTAIECQYLFPGDSDPLLWATAGVDPGFSWDETTDDNAEADRRFVQSAGPFTLRPGAINNITVGIVYGRGSDGDLFSSVNSMKTADTKAQALFDNCFKILDPPDAPRLRIQELENELILMIDNPATSNNFREQYEQIDNVNIVDPGVDRFYRFEGYQIFQLKDEDASVADFQDPTKARLVAQCDLKNFAKDEDGNDILSQPIDRLINHDFDEDLGFAIPTEMVNGANEGIQHSFQIKEDKFAQGDAALVNHKTYYYVAIAYAHNNFKEYDPTDPLLLDGQTKRYIASRIGFDKKAIQPVAAIPHNPRPEAGGTGQLIGYGSSPRITRLDGHGNGGKVLELTEESENFIINNGSMDEVEYDFGAGPINVKVIDPLSLKEGYYECKFRDYQISGSNTGADTASWVIYRYEGSTEADKGAIVDSVESEVSIDVDNEQLIPDWGLSVQLHQKLYYFEEDGLSGGQRDETTDILEADITFVDSSKRWLEFIEDVDGFSPLNWIRSGSTKAADDYEYNPALLFNNENCYDDEVKLDDDKRWAKILNGGIAPHRLVGYQCDFMPLAYYDNNPNYPNSAETSPGNARNSAGLSFSPSIDIVITSDQSKWTRVPVIELGRDPSLNVGGVDPGVLRASPSVGKDGLPDGTGTGMSWFPGYAIDIESGARLHMAFGENSSLGTDNGGDMIWNPSSRLTDNLNSPRLGGMHPVYVFSYKQKSITGNVSNYDMGAYNPQTNGAELTDLFNQVVSGNGAAKTQFYSSLSWIGYPILGDNRDLLETDARIRVRISKEYKTLNVTGKNDGKPMYSWSMDGIATRTNSKDDLAEALKLINVVPNPYYAYSEYERGRLDTRVKITNLPEICDVKIYSTNGKLVRAFKKDSPVTSLDWDLQNTKGIQVASGIYLIHVTVPDVGEVVVKFYGAMREIDLQGI